MSVKKLERLREMQLTDPVSTAADDLRFTPGK